MHSRRRTPLIVALLTVALSGCGGGGGSTTNPTTTNTTTPTTTNTTTPTTTNTATAVKTWEFYRRSTASTKGPLYAIAPSQPSLPQVVDSHAVEVAAPVVDGTFTSGAVDGEYVSNVVYARTDGTLWRASTDLNVSPPVPVRVTTQGGSTVCTFNVGPDFKTADNASVVVGLKGSSACSNGVGSWKIFHLGAGSGQAPASFPGTPLVGLIDPTDGSHRGWLALTGGAIGRITESAGVATPHSVTGSPSAIAKADYLETLANGNVMLNLDGTLYEYRLSNDSMHAVGASPFTFAVETYFGSQVAGKKPENAVADGNELYFVDNNTLYRTNLSANTVVVLDKPGDAVEDFGGALTGAPRLTVTDKQVVWSYPVDRNSDTLADHLVIRNVDKLSGAASTVEEIQRFAALDGSLQGVFDRSGGWFFYTRQTGSGTYTAVAYNADNGTMQTYTDGQWAGDTVNLGAFSGLGASVQRAFMVSGISNVLAGKGGSLKVFSVANPSAGLTSLGAIPSGAQALLMAGGFGPGRLGAMTVDNGSGGTQIDVIYADGSSSGSLTRVTNTTENETPVAFF